MDTTTRTRLAAVAAVLVVLLAWLVPSPLPWRSPFEGRSDRAGAQQGELSVGAGVNADISGTVPPPPSGTSGGPTATSSARPSTPGTPTNAPTTVPAAFRGTWHGHGSNLLDGSQFTVAVTIRAKPAGSVAATADFPSLGCQESWQLRKTTAQVLTLTASLASGLCVVRPLQVQVQLLAHDRVFIRWRLQDSVVESEATLTRVS
jgi:hypothetical protein